METGGQEMIEIKSINYHRNGISGAGFHVVQFTQREAGAYYDGFAERYAKFVAEFEEEEK